MKNQLKELLFCTNAVQKEIVTGLLKSREQLFLFTIINSRLELTKEPLDVSSLINSFSKDSWGDAMIGISPDHWADAQSFIRTDSHIASLIREASYRYNELGYNEVAECQVFDWQCEMEFAML